MEVALYRTASLFPYIANLPDSRHQHVPQHKEEEEAGLMLLGFTTGRADAHARVPPSVS